MNTLGRMLLALALVPLSLVALWLAIAAIDDRTTYMALGRSGLLLIGLFALVWGVLLLRPGIAALGLMFLVSGFVTFGVDLSEASPSAPVGLEVSDFLCRVGCGLTRPLTISNGVCLWHVALCGLLLLNGLLISQHAPSWRVAGGNLAMIAGILFVAIMIGR